MRTTARLATLALAATTLLAFATTTATASRAIQIRPSGISNTGRITVGYSELMRTASINCNVTLGLEYVATMFKSSVGRLSEGKIGNITSARTAGCRELFTNWEVTFLIIEGNPQPIRYDAFLGTLPNITGLLLTALEVGVRITSRNVNCLFRGDVPFLEFEAGGGQRFNRKTFLDHTLSYVGGMPCPASSALKIAGTLAMEPAMEVALT